MLNVRKKGRVLRTPAPHAVRCLVMRRLAPPRTLSVGPFQLCNALSQLANCAAHSTHVSHESHRGRGSAIGISDELQRKLDGDFPTVFAKGWDTK
jgi:hypothetical protein